MSRRRSAVLKADPCDEFVGAIHGLPPSEEWVSKDRDIVVLGVPKGGEYEKGVDVFKSGWRLGIEGPNGRRIL